MFWSKDKTVKNEIADDIPDKESDASLNTDDTNLNMNSILHDMDTEVKRNNAESLREKAGNRAQQLELSKFPKELSCMTALDELMQCMSLGGQIRNYYRFGDLTLCDKQSEKLNFCFSNSLNTEDIKEINIQTFYKERLVETLKRGSSEDVWESRD